MQINWNGYSCFTIKTKTATIVTDPFSPEIGINLPKLGADIITVSHDHPGHNNVKAVEGNPQVIDWPGEFDIKGVFINGLSTFHSPKDGEDLGPNIVFSYRAEDIFLCHLGDIGHVLTTEHVDEIGQVNVLMIPVGEGHSINVKKAKEIIEKLDPNIVIPMHFLQPGLKRNDLKSVKDFFTELGVNHPEMVDELKIAKKDLMTEDTRFILFNQ